MATKLLIGTIRLYVERSGYKLLSTEYINAHTKLLCECPNRHSLAIRWNDFQQGHRCSICVGNQNKTIDAIRAFIEGTGHRLLSPKFKNTRTKLILECPQGHQFAMRWNDFRWGYRCSTCAGNQRKTIDAVKTFTSNCGYALLSTVYQNAYTKLQYRCYRGHQFEMCWHDFQRGHRCPVCAGLDSKGERELAAWVKQQGVVVRRRVRSLIPPYEIDIYIPLLNVGIEYHGLYWHSEYFRKPTDHQKKWKDCKERGIRLVQVFEDEWLQKPDIVKTRLAQILMLRTQKLFARCCKCRIIDNRLARIFCAQHHIQGGGTTRVSYGLYHSDELISVMTFSKTSRVKGGNEQDWEINRFCSSIPVVGGASKLFTHFIRDHRPIKVISYCDLRWGTGKTYENIGMKLDGITRPCYWYVDGQRVRKHRYSVRATPTLTEREHAKSLGVYRIYDAGSAKYVWVL